MKRAGVEENSEGAERATREGKRKSGEAHDVTSKRSVDEDRNRENRHP